MLYIPILFTLHPPHLTMARLGRPGGYPTEPSTPTKETLAMIAASSPTVPLQPRQFPGSGKSPNTKRKIKKKKKKKKATPEFDVTTNTAPFSGESDAASAESSVGRLSGVSARSGKDNPAYNNLLMQIERLELQNIGSKLNEHKSRSVLSEEKRKHEGVLQEVENKLRESQREVEALKVGRMPRQEQFAHTHARSP